MPPALIPSDNEYASEEDSDFVDDATPAQGDEESSDDDSDVNDPESVPRSSKRGTGKAKSTKRKRDAEDGEAEDAGFENSGDEAIIEKGLKRQRRKGKKGLDEDDEGGEGGLVKTRSMRAQEKIEKKPLATTTGATIDVDAIWEQMISNKPPPSPATLSTNGPTAQENGALSPSASRTERPAQPARSPSTTLSDDPNAMIMIKRTYNFAGKVHTEQKLVSRHSAEAKLYLASQPDPSSVPDETPSTEQDPSDPSTKPRRPPRKARRSIFEPVVENLPVRTDLHFGIRKDREGITLLGGGTGKEKKLNTVEKSAMDWAGFVDKEGIADELDAAGKSKGAYRARQEFLARVEGKRVDDERRARGLPALS